MPQLCAMRNQFLFAISCLNDCGQLEMSATGIHRLDRPYSGFEF
jgi:hypothetical protein